MFVLIPALRIGDIIVVYTTEHNTNGYTGFNGTSAACPHVSGVAGLMLSHVDVSSPNINNLVVEDVENILQMSASDRGLPGYDVFAGWGMLDATAAMNKIRRPAYKIQHFGVGENVISYSISNSLVASNLKVMLPINHHSLIAGYYYIDRYEVTVTLNYNLNSPTDQIIGYWPRFSSTVGWDAVDPIHVDNWCQIISVSNTQAVLRTYIDNFKYDANGNQIVDPWFPVTLPFAKAALSIYTFDPTMAGVNDVNSGVNFFNAYPNPTNDNLNVSISLNHSQVISLELFDAQGKIVKVIATGAASEGKNDYDFSVADISEGVYFIRLVTETVCYEKKVIVMK